MIQSRDVSDVPMKGRLWRRMERRMVSKAILRLKRKRVDNSLESAAKRKLLVPLFKAVSALCRREKPDWISCRHYCWRGASESDKLHLFSKLWKQNKRWARTVVCCYERSDWVDSWVNKSIDLVVLVVNDWNELQHTPDKNAGCQPPLFLTSCFWIQGQFTFTPGHNCLYTCSALSF